jgi:hypothetical protein
MRNVLGDDHVLLEKSVTLFRRAGCFKYISMGKFMYNMSNKVSPHYNITLNPTT